MPLNPVLLSTLDSLFTVPRPLLLWIVEAGRMNDSGCGGRYQRDTEEVVEGGGAMVVCMAVLVGSRKMEG